MSHKISIIDFKNQDSGLKILFPESDYYILEEEFDRTRINTKYNINPIVHQKHGNVFQLINDKKYDTLFIIAGLYASLKIYNNKINPFFNQRFQSQVLDIVAFIEKNNFKHVSFFDNEDYDYDPNIIFDDTFIVSKKISFFKRYVNKEKKYKPNVLPFPYIMFGHQCNIEMMTDLYYNNISGQAPDKINRIFFSGSPLVHIDNTYGIVRNRKDILNNIKGRINLYNPHNMPHYLFMDVIKNSKYSLDLLGCGDPNVRTFEILSCGSLRISQRSNIKWNFEEEFCEETIFDNENDLYEKIIKLDNDVELYKKCIDKQNEIVLKHMNTDVLRNYILNRLNQN